MKLIENFIDLLALLLMVLIIPGLWVADAVDLIELAEQAQGAIIAVFTMIAMFYFRKRKGETH